MKEQGLRNKDPEPINRSTGHVSSLLTGRRWEITLKMARQLKDYFKLRQR